LHFPKRPNVTPRLGLLGMNLNPCVIEECMAGLRS
jgi:hypothetical protein